VKGTLDLAAGIHIAQIVVELYLDEHPGMETGRAPTFLLTDDMFKIQPFYNLTHQPKRMVQRDTLENILRKKPQTIGGKRFELYVSHIFLGAP